ncbi:hypothetical protein [Halalkalibacter flavus]|uniref:hypothetical protein n=1 Tax=Halalkalibacter flavus TaxID=3090668 RepID=UPI002FCADFB1
MGIRPRPQNRLTSGPFFVPLSIDGDPEEGAVDFLLIGFKNLARLPSTVDVSVHVCRDLDLFPATPPEIEIFRQDDVTIPAGNCAVLKVDSGPGTFTGNNMLRVVVEGDIDKDGDRIVVALSGGNEDGRTAVSMVFKHEEFIEFDD